MDEREAADHEAGHAVAAYYRGLPMEGADISRTEGRVGQVRMGDPPEGWDSTLPGEAWESWRYGRMVASMAGVRAVEILTGEPPSKLDPNMMQGVPGSDWSGLSFLWAEVGEDGLQRANDEAVWVLRDNWHCVEAVAGSFMERATLDREDLYEA